MARYKLIRPSFDDPNDKLAKKRKRIIEIVTWIYAFLALVGICVGGLHQDNDLIVGWTVLTFGIVTLFYTLFCVYAVIKKWMPVIPYNYMEIHQYKTEKLKERYLAEYRVIFGIVIVILSGVSIVMLVAGILRLCEIA